MFEISQSNSNYGPRRSVKLLLRKIIIVCNNISISYFIILFYY